MIKTILELIAKVLESKLAKSGLEAEILKNKNYIDEAKNIWHMIDENHRISKTVQEKLVSKVDQFNSALLAKFPELDQSDIDKLRQSVAGEFNQDKEDVINNLDLIKQLKDSNDSLIAKNKELEFQLSQIKVISTNSKNEAEKGEVL